MPELPEVETVKNTLKKILIGLTITDIKINYGNIVESDHEEFKKYLIGEEFKDIKRYGKYLIFIFNNCSMLSHLRMEGKFFIKNKNDYVEKHEHVLFTLSNGSELRYHDTRKFGIMKLIKSTNIDDIMNDSYLIKLGIEGNDPKLTKEYLYEKLNKSLNPIKVDLLDQSIIAGLGNIYVDEVLFKCNIHPEQISKTISLEDCSNIVKYSKEVLDYAIECGGTTIRSYLSSLGVTGRFQINLMVHTKEGEPCMKCGTIIKKIFVGGRGTYYCSKCQEKHPVIIGLTGGISSGKSSISKYIKDHYNSIIIDADEISKEVSKEKEFIKRIVSEFGPTVINDNNEINRKELARIVFSNKNDLIKLNNILHPSIIRRIKNLVKKYSLLDYKYIVVEAPLLLECNLDDICDKVIVVTIDKNTQIERLMARDNIDKDYAIAKINSQITDEDRTNLVKKRHYSDDVYFIDNSSSLCYTYETLEKLFN